MQSQSACLAIMDRLLSFLPLTSRVPRAPRAPVPPAITAKSPTLNMTEYIAVQKALDEVLEYHQTHRPKNTAKNHEPKQNERR
ncbi:hypothetical protein BJ878DRAFT_515649 [Calycina marina]|uniref:Uncharacterized protein n=1 Tax=Calycina marina TaxID=1763456 RepID=A0A9P7YZ18_9HELO|nr:hypothetical protein BJ878DRAFT_515649 [Calycina marina]